MFQKKGKFLPIVITVLIIAIIIYLFATAKQPLVACNRKIKDDLGITVSEKLEATIDGSHISGMVLVKTISLPEKFLDNDSKLNSVMFSLEKAYKYLGDKVSINKTGTSVIVKIDIDDDETIILNNIEFFYNDGLEMKINSNTKSSEVITLKVGDNYTEGELMARLKNNGYSCS